MCGMAKAKKKMSVSSVAIVAWLLASPSYGGSAAQDGYQQGGVIALLQQV